MNAELVFFGRRVDMALQRRRRVLVVAIYGALAALMIGLGVFTHSRSLTAYVVWAAILACRLFLGGYYSGGLIKPFEKARYHSEIPPALLLLRLRVYQAIPGGESGPSINDERELLQRDRAHYLAYRTLAISVAAVWFLLSLSGNHALFDWNAMVSNQVCSGLLLATLLLFLTLPQAILLWTEPDMEAD
jgi:hypothetical protein